METFDALTEFYNNYDEEGRLLSRHGSVEFLTTMCVRRPGGAGIPQAMVH